jgi:hypothetical protein
MSDTVFWAAFAAIVSVVGALASWTSYLLHRRSSREAVRPEIELTGWARMQSELPFNEDRIVFRGIKNVGNGVAHRIGIFCPNPDTNKSAVITDMTNLPILGAGDQKDIEGGFSIIWRNVSKKGNFPKHLGAVVTIYSWDVRNIRHKTEYKFSVFDITDGPVGADNPTMRGVSSLLRVTSSRSTLSLKMERWIRNSFSVFSRKNKK